MELSPENTSITIRSDEAGPTLTVFAAVHGNETVGVMAINELLRSDFAIKKGTVNFVLANPFAYSKSIRQCEVNLNRIFSADTASNFPEEKRAHELMETLRRSDALLDIHAFNSKKGIPFILGNETMKEYAQNFPFDIFSYGWDVLEPGDTCDFMHKQNKTALCVECGSVFESPKYISLAIESIRIFLATFGMVDFNVKKHFQKVVHVHTIGIKKTDTFSFSKEYGEFEKLEEGKIFATDDQTEYKATEGDVIVFPRPSKPIGGEVFLIGSYE